MKKVSNFLNRYKKKIIFILILNEIRGIFFVGMVLYGGYEFFR